MKPTIVFRLLQKVAHACDRLGVLIILLAILSCALCAQLAVTRLGLYSSRNDLVVLNSPSHQRYLEFNRDFPLQDSAVVVVTSSSRARTHDVVDNVGRLLRRDASKVEAVYDKVDTQFVSGRLLLFLSQADSSRLLSAAQGAGFFLRELAQHPSVVYTLTHLDETLRGLVAAAGHHQKVNAQPFLEQAEQILPALSGGLRQLSSTVSSSAPPQSLWQQMTEGTNLPSDQMYLELQQGKTCLIVVKPRAGALGDVRQMIAQVQSVYPQVQIGLTGKPAMDDDQVRITTQDVKTTTIVSLCGVCLFFVLTFRGVSRPLLSLACIVLGLLWTLGFAAVTIGYLDPVTAIALPMLVGLGIDFAIQIVTRYDEELADRHEPRQAMMNTLTGTGSSVVTATVTIAVVFSATAMCGLAAIQDLALLAGVGIILCAIAMLFVLPSCLLRMTRLRAVPPDAHRLLPLHSLARLEKGALAHAPGLVLVAVLVTVWCCRLIPNVPYDPNLMHLQASDVESTEWSQYLERVSGHGVVSAALVADNVEQARHFEQRLAELPTVAVAMSVVPLFPSEATNKIHAVRQLQQILPTRLATEKRVTAQDIRTLRAAIVDLRQLLLALYPEAERARGERLGAKIREFVTALDSFEDALAAVAPATAAARLDAFQHGLYSDVRGLLALAHEPTQTSPLRVETLPSPLRTSIIGKSGKILVAAFPRGNIWEPQELERFVGQLREVDPNVTGFPVEYYESSRLVRSGYTQAIYYAALAVTLLSILHFRSVLTSLLALVPVALALLWMLGIQVYFNLPFNMANQMVVPLLLGIAASNGIYVVRRCQEEGWPAVFSVSTGRAILLSNMMAMIGFGSLIVARYPAISSVGAIMTIGLICCMFSSLVILPAFLELLYRHGPRLFWYHLLRRAGVFYRGHRPLMLPDH